MLEQASWMAGIVAAVAAVIALVLRGRARSVQKNIQNARVSGQNNRVCQASKNADRSDEDCK